MEHEKRLPKVIDLKQLKTLVPYSSQHIARLEAAGKFPKRIRLGSNRVGWLEAEIYLWIADKAMERFHASIDAGGAAK